MKTNYFHNFLLLNSERNSGRRWD